jgi:hypothetical protein
VAHYEGPHDGWAQRDWSQVDRYGLRYLPAHLHEAKEVDMLRRLLLDFDWLQAKVKASDVIALLDDFRRLGDDPSVAAVHQALQQAAHILSHRDVDWSGADQLTSQILARLQHQTDPAIR